MLTCIVLTYGFNNGLNFTKLCGRLFKLHYRYSAGAMFAYGNISNFGELRRTYIYIILFSVLTVLLTL